MSWPVTWPDWAAADQMDPNIKNLCEVYARMSLTALTLQRVGGTPVTVMPEPSWRQWGYSAVRDGIYGPFMVNFSGEDLRAGWLFEHIEALVIPGHVAAVEQVVIDGTTLDPQKYRVEDGNRLIRTDGGLWPTRQGQNFTVRYYDTAPPGELGSYALGVLAAEFAKLITMSKEKCRLPRSITNVSRQGLTFEIAKGMFPDGLTGIPEVDAFIYLYNPHGLKVRPRVYSPDLPKRRQVTA